MNQFTQPYQNRRKHRAKCDECNRLIQDGEPTRFYEATYGCRGNGFNQKGWTTVKWRFMHESCAQKAEAQGRHEPMEKAA